MSVKIFYVSLQRCGTKSFGWFFRNNQYPIASWGQTQRNDWMELALQGQWQRIVDSKAFGRAAAFEDGPWFDLATIRFLYSAIPESRFIYFHRPVEDWFQSMLNLNGGKIIGDPKRHCQIYSRLHDYYESGTVNGANLSMKGMLEHYSREFSNHALQIRAFFENKPIERFAIGELYDQDKWRKIEAQWKLGWDALDDVHYHQSKIRVSDTLPDTAAGDQTS